MSAALVDWEGLGDEVAALAARRVAASVESSLS